MPDQIEPIMQAAERLIRLKSGESIRDVYPDGPLPWDEMCRDQGTVCDAILPKGKRPVATCSYDATTGTMLWNFDEDGGIYYGVVIEHNGEGTGGIHWDNSVGYDDEGYESEEAAKLAFHWQHFDAICGVKREEINQ